MDLLAGIRKSGSRGGVNFSWDDVASSVHRENYLGHSLKAPVGRWQKGKDLNWYAKGDAEQDEGQQERARKEELRKIKEAEEDAMARALGLPPPQRDKTGANATEMGAQRAAEQTADGGAADAAQEPTRGDEGPERKEGKRERNGSRDRHREKRHRHRRSEVDRPRHPSLERRGRDREESYRPRHRSPEHSQRRSERARPRGYAGYDRRDRSRDRFDDRRRHSRERYRRRSRSRSRSRSPPGRQRHRRD